MTPNNKSVLWMMMIPLIIMMSYFSPARADSSYRDSIAILYLSTQMQNYHKPWQKWPPMQREVPAIYVGQNKWLVANIDLKFAKDLQLSTLDSGARFPAQILVVDELLGLAMLESQAPDLANKMKPVKFLKQPFLQRNQQILVFSYHHKKGEQERRAHAQSLEVNDHWFLAYPTLDQRLDIDQDSSGVDAGDPVFVGGRLAGMVNKHHEKICYVTPLYVLQQFVEDVLARGQSRSVARIDFELAPLDMPAQRRLLKIKGLDVHQGALVRKVFPYSELEKKFNHQTVVTQIDRYSVDAQGRIYISPWGYLSYKYVFLFKRANDPIRVVYWQNNKKQVINYLVKAFNPVAYRVPLKLSSKEVDFLIVGGAVLQELNLPYLESWGPKWLKRVLDRWLMELFKNVPVVGNEEQGIVIVNTIISDPVNHGYQEIRQARVLRINGQKVYSLKQVRTALKQPVSKKNQQSFISIELDGEDGILVFPYDGLHTVNKRIAEKYGIHYSDDIFFNP